MTGPDKCIIVGGLRWGLALLTHNLGTDDVCVSIVEADDAGPV
jgi:hypothetical protein